MTSYFGYPGNINHKISIFLKKKISYVENNKKLSVKECMMKRTIAVLAGLLFLATAGKNELFPLSSSVKSKQEYQYTLNTLRNIKIMVDNFADENEKTQYNEIQKLFREAAKEYYGRNYESAYNKFISIKFKLIDFCKIIAQKYLDRTKEILDSTNEQTFDILIKYSKKSGLAEYLRQPFDPLRDVKPLKEEEYHYFWNKSLMATYLKEGYKSYQEAKNYFNDPEIEMQLNRKKITSSGQNYVISRYLNTVYSCRLAKQYGIEIYKIMNMNELGKSLVKYNIPARSIEPIFDDRIPEEYKVDANDNKRLIHSVEKKRLLKYRGTSNTNE